MPFIPPMLASTMKPDFEVTPGVYAVEEKFDGHRLCVAVAENGGNLFGDPSVTAWSRNGIPRILPPHIRTVLEKFPSGVYDGELIVPGERSYGVTVIEDFDRQAVILFDLVELMGKSLVKETYDDRRLLLSTILKERGDPAVRLSESVNVDSYEAICALRDAVWARQGEGLIVKRRAAPYASGKRNRDWVKVKDLQSTVMTVIGYRQGEMGPHSVIMLRGEDNMITSVKWKDLAMLADVEANHEKYIGREVRILFQERTPDGGYRHPRWDRWEDE